MIIVDIETTGLNPQTHDIASIGAVLLHNETKYFYRECRIRQTALVDEFALKVNGFTEDRLRDPLKSDSVTAVGQFIEWAKSHGQQLLGGENLGSFDVQFLMDVCHRGGHKWIFGHRFVDLHSLGVGRFGVSSKADVLYERLGLAAEPKPHNALNGALWERRAFQILLPPNSL